MTSYSVLARFIFLNSNFNNFLAVRVALTDRYIDPPSDQLRTFSLRPLQLEVLLSSVEGTQVSGGIQNCYL